MAVGGGKKERRSKSLKTLDFIRAAFGACVSFPVLGEQAASSVRGRGKSRSMQGGGRAAKRRKLRCFCR